MYINMSVHSGKGGMEWALRKSGGFVGQWLAPGSMARLAAGLAGCAEMSRRRAGRSDA
jgi:hypothetical protein